MAEKDMKAVSLDHLGADSWQSQDWVDTFFQRLFCFFPHGPFFSPTPFFNIPFFKDFSSFFKGSLSLKACAFSKASCAFFKASLWLTRMKFLCPNYFICCCLSYLGNQFVTVQSFDNSWQRDYTNIWMQLWIQSYILDLDASLHYIYKIFIWD